MNRDREIELRRYQNSLRICGGGAIAFGLWSVLKVYLSFFFGDLTFGGIIQESLAVASSQDVPGLELVLWIILLGVTFLVGAMVFGVHLFVGLRAFGAAREDNRKKPTGGYLVLAGIFALFSGLSIVVSFLSLGDGASWENISLAALFVDITSLYLYVDLIRSAGKVKRLGALLAEGA